METTMVREFEGRSMRVRPWRGRLWVEARNLGDVLGYTDPSEVLRVVDRHAEDFVEGTDVVVLRGSDLAEYLGGDRQTDGHKTEDAMVRNLTLLSELAARMVAMLARTPDAARVRRWLAEVWSQIARTGSYQPPAAPALGRDVLYGSLPEMTVAIGEWLRRGEHPAGFRRERFTAGDVLRCGFGVAEEHGLLVSVGKALARLGLQSRPAHGSRLWTVAGWTGTVPAVPPPPVVRPAPTSALALLDSGERSSLAGVFAEKGRAAVASGDRARAQLAFDAALLAMG
jgi:prophage antirepressor-like protein